MRHGCLRLGRLSLEKAIDCYWQFFLDGWPMLQILSLTLCIMRGRYIIMRITMGNTNHRRSWSSVSVQGAILRVQACCRSLSVFDFRCTASRDWPWWVESWRHRIASKYEKIDWPDTLEIA